MKNVVVYGAYGHTGRFVVAELVRRGLTPILSGRNQQALAELGREYSDLEVRAASVDDPASLARAMQGAAAVINCAGPFLDTALPIAAAAVRAEVHYLDTAAEQRPVQNLYAAHPGGTVAVVPAMAFYGGLADLMATVATGDWADVDEITTAIGLDRWWPTEGTRITGERNTYPRLVVEEGRLVPMSAEAREWVFPEPIGPQKLQEIAFSEIVVLERHLTASSIRTFLAADALADVREESTPAPEAVDESGRSAQHFAVDVVVRRGTTRRRVVVTGRDIYAVTAPLIVEATQRLVDGRATGRGAAAPGAIYDAEDFLAALAPEHLTLARTSES